MAFDINIAVLVLLGMLGVSIIIIVLNRWIGVKKIEKQ